jgi:hypothetical protein
VNWRHSVNFKLPRLNETTRDGDFFLLKCGQRLEPLRLIYVAIFANLGESA